MSDERPIGVFDSGVGGLTVFREVMRRVPGEKLIYFGDTARLPYGTKSRETIIGFARQIVRFLKTKDVKAIVVACNTASAYALDVIETEEDIPFIGVVKPGARVAASATKNGRIGVIATSGTISSGMYGNYIHSIDPTLKVFGKECPLFVPLVEEGWLHDSVTREVASRYLNELKGEFIDTLILGCTHYPLIRRLIAEEMGEDVKLVNPAYETARGLLELLKENGLEASPKDAPQKHEFYVSDAAERFLTFAKAVLSCEISSTNVVDIERY